jgi:hypothetical protein
MGVGYTFWGKFHFVPECPFCRFTVRKPYKAYRGQLSQGRINLYTTYPKLLRKALNALWSPINGYL